MRRIEQFHHPRSLDEAVRLLDSANGSAAVIAGGTTIVANLPPHVKAVVDVTRLGLDRIEPATEALRIGACATLRHISESEPLRTHLDGILHSAVMQSSSRLLRNASTVGGCIAKADPACDIVAALLAADATVHLQSSKGTEHVALDALLAQPAQHLAPSAIITAIELPRMPANTRARFEKLNRSAHDAPIVTAVARLCIREGRLEGVRAVLGGLTHRPFRASRVEKALEGGPADVGAIERACADAAEGINVAADVRATAEYRAHMAVVLLRRALVGTLA